MLGTVHNLCWYC